MLNQTQSISTIMTGQTAIDCHPSVMKHHSKLQRLSVGGNEADCVASCAVVATVVVVAAAAAAADFHFPKLNRDREREREEERKMGSPSIMAVKVSDE